MQRGPLFIAGLDRSGKTQLRLMLSSHPNLALTRRTYLWSKYFNRYGDLGQQENFERCLAAMMKSKHIRLLSPDPDRLRQEFRQGQPTYPRLFSLIHAHFAESLGKPRWGDQMGLIEGYADPIFSAYPDARMIHLVRHPADRYAASTTSAGGHAGKLGWELARWLYSVNLAQRNQALYSGRYKIVLYEHFVAKPEETLRQVCDFIGEDFFPGMLNMENAIRFGEEESDRSENRLAALTFPGNGFHETLSRREIAFAQTFAGGDMHALGYPVEKIALSPGDQIQLYLFDWPANRAGMLAWRLKKPRV